MSANVDREGAFLDALLEAGRRDAPSEEAANVAWKKLSGSLAGAAAGAAIGHGLASSRAVRWLVKGLVVGAVGGSIATASWFAGRGAAPRSTAAIPVLVPIVASSPVPIASASHDESIVPAPEVVVAKVDAPKAIEKPRVVAAPIAVPSVVASPIAVASALPVADASPPPSANVSPASTLAAEVDALDRARLSIATGRSSDAVDEIAAYRAAFPHGALAHDADVVEIEAFAAHGDRDSLKKAADRFLAAYPNDPQTARVKWLASH